MVFPIWSAFALSLVWTGTASTSFGLNSVKDSHPNRITTQRISASSMIPIDFNTVFVETTSFIFYAFSLVETGTGINFFLTFWLFFCVNAGLVFKKKDMNKKEGHFFYRINIALWK